jgi:hypothetical protein
MKERQIPFSGEMVRAILDGRKTQTRRVVRLPHNNPLGAWEPMTLGGPNGGRTKDGHTIPFQGGIWHTRTGDCLMSPHGQPGDRLWVREAWRTTSNFDEHSGSRIAEMCLDAGYKKPWAPIQYEADGHRVNWEHTSTPPHDDEPIPGRYRHGRFMPRWASRVTLEVTGVRVERLDDISESDARAEGVTIEDCHMNRYCAGEHRPPSIRTFRDLWESINGDGSWNENPWVWVVEFRRQDGSENGNA